jgi:exodeoxyribonuclease VII small subunit
VKEKLMGPEKDHKRNTPARRAELVTPVSQLGYEECRGELIEVVRLLEQGGLDLDASLELWERGEKLARRCEEHLAGARKRVADALAGGEAEES